MAGSKTNVKKSDQAAAAAEIESRKGKAYTRAARRLRADDPDKWNRYLREEYERDGLSWSPRLTKEERERQQLADLIAAYPAEARSLVPPEDGSDAAG
jgi:hypothetical protein